MFHIFVLQKLVDVCIAAWFFLIGRYTTTVSRYKKEKHWFWVVLLISLGVLCLYFIASETAKISITSPHEGAWVFIDGKRIAPVEKGKAIERKIELGKHTVRLTHTSGIFEDNIQQDVLVGWRTKIMQDVSLCRKKGSILILAYPEGEVSIKVNGVDKGTKYVLDSVEARGYQIEALYKGKIKTRIFNFYGGERRIVFDFRLYCNI